MIKAIFLDMDETLCDTSGADLKALKAMTDELVNILSTKQSAAAMAQAYLDGVYKRLPDHYADQLLPVIDEYQYRKQLIRVLLVEAGINSPAESVVEQLQNVFDSAREKALSFYAGLPDVLKSWRESFALVVITNGPEFSQLFKIDVLNLEPLVDHIIIGGQEKEEKPAVSIFNKALALAGVEPNEAIHIGDKLATDVLGANRSGIPSVWVSHGQPLDEASDIHPTYTIECPTDMAALVERLTTTHS